MLQEMRLWCLYRKLYFTSELVEQPNVEKYVIGRLFKPIFESNYFDLLRSLATLLYDVLVDANDLAFLGFALASHDVSYF